MRTLVAILVLATRALAIDPPITALAFVPDGKEVLAGSQAGVRVHSWPELKLQRAIKTELAHIHDLSFSPDRKMLAIAGGVPAERGTVELFSWPEMRLLHRISPHQDVIHSLSWSADSKMLATASADRTVEIHNAASGTTTTKLEGHSRPVLAVTFLPGDSTLVSSGVDGTLRIWTLTTGKVERELSYHTKAVNALAVKPAKDQSGPPVLASIGEDKTVRIWQPSIGRMMRFARLPSEPQSLAWTADGTELIVACKDGSLRIVNAETVEVRSTHPAVEGKAYSLALAADGSMLVGGGNGQLKRVRKSD